jgi:hypothetical protein
MKRCPDCLQYKPLSEFPRNRRTKSGYATYCKPCHNARGTETRTRLYGSSRHYHLKRRYGIGALKVDELVREQDGMCPICDKPGPEHVDHDHVTGRVRGVLCFNCNGGLGQFGDNPERLYRAALPRRRFGATPRRHQAADRICSRAGARVAGECGVGCAYGVSRVAGWWCAAGAGGGGVRPSARSGHGGGASAAVGRGAPSHGRRATRAQAAASSVVLATVSPRSLTQHPCRLARR